MHGFIIVELDHINRVPFRIQDIPIISAFNTFIAGRHDNARLNIIIEVEGKTNLEIRNKLEQQRKNLKLYLNLITENKIDLKLVHDVELYDNKTALDKNWQKTLKLLEDPDLLKYIDRNHSQQDVILQQGLNEVLGSSDSMFNGFPKLINWLDENDSKV